MEINTNPNYLNNVQNQNAQGANSATAEKVVEENLFDGNEANATQNNAVSQDYQNAEMLNTFVAAFTAVMAPFMQMIHQLFDSDTNIQNNSNKSQALPKKLEDSKKTSSKQIDDFQNKKKENENIENVELPKFIPPFISPNTNRLDIGGEQLYLEQTAKTESNNAVTIYYPAGKKKAGVENKQTSKKAMETTTPMVKAFYEIMNNHSINDNQAWVADYNIGILRLVNINDESIVQSYIYKE